MFFEVAHRRSYHGFHLKPQSLLIRRVEVTLHSLGSTGDIRIGVAPTATHVPAGRLGTIHWPGSLSFNVQDGSVYRLGKVLPAKPGSVSGRVLLKAGDVVGVGWSGSKSLVFTVNGFLAGIYELTDMGSVASLSFTICIERCAG